MWGKEQQWSVTLRTLKEKWYEYVARPKRRVAHNTGTKEKRKEGERGEKKGRRKKKERERC